jgi:thiol-disulfide isomerase/thioredoxin
MERYFNHTIAKILAKTEREDEFIRKFSAGFSLVKFFSSTCSHCKVTRIFFKFLYDFFKFVYFKDMAKEWSKLEKAYKHSHEVKILSINCKMDKAICSKFHIDSYPRIFWFTNGKKHERFTGDKTFEELHNFVEIMMRRHSKKLELL